MKHEMNDYKMPVESALASVDLEYKETRADFYKRCPEAKILDDKLIRGEITTDEAVDEIIKQGKEEYQKLLKKMLNKLHSDPNYSR